MAVSSTGKLVGTLEIQAGMPLSVRYAQKGFPRRRQAGPPPSSGRCRSPKFDGQARLAVLEDREDGHVRRRVARDEVADAVATRRLAGDEARPRDRAERRHGGGEGQQRTPLAQLLEVRQTSLGDEGAHDAGVQAVHAEHDGLSGCGATPRPARHERRGQAGRGASRHEPQDSAAIDGVLRRRRVGRDDPRLHHQPIHRSAIVRNIRAYAHKCNRSLGGAPLTITII